MSARLGTKRQATRQHANRSRRRVRPRPLLVEKLDERALLATFHEAEGVGWEGAGADFVYVDLNNNGIDDVIAMAYDAPKYANHFRYRIGYDVGADGAPRRWSDIKYGPSAGWEGQGAGLAVAYLDDNPRPDIIFMAYDNPEGANSFRYFVGYNMTATGAVSSWSPRRQIDGVGWEGAGAGLAITNLDADPRPDAIFMAYDDPEGPNTFRYRIGYNLDAQGRAQRVSGPIVVSGVGWKADGAGIAIANLDNNPSPDVVLMAYDAPDGANTFRLKIGYNLGSNGRAERWSSPIEVAGLGWKGAGAGIAVRDLDGDGRDEFIFMAYDDPSGSNEFRFMVHAGEPTARVVGTQLRVDVGLRGGTTTVSTGPGNTLLVTAARLDGSQHRQTFSAVNVQSIRINGSEASDVIRNDTRLPGWIFGHGLHDTIFGGSGTDWLYGGDGNDNLYGRGGADFLFGGRGNDGLFGGIGGQDYLHGGPGSDRFLQPKRFLPPPFGMIQVDEDDVVDFNADEDALIEFWADTRTWTDADILDIDQGLAALHHLTGNNALLVDSVRDDPLRFYRYRTDADHPGGGDHGFNRTNTHHIYIGNGAFDSLQWTVQVVIHEIAHNWDELLENSIVFPFRQASFWMHLPEGISVTTHTPATDGWHALTTAEFARDYGRIANPLEDFATSFEAYVMRETGWQMLTDGGTTQGFRDWLNRTGPMPAKLGPIDQWIRSIRA